MHIPRITLAEYPWSSQSPNARVRITQCRQLSHQPETLLTTGKSYTLPFLHLAFPHIKIPTPRNAYT